jgi:hypothetical protein
LRGRLGGCVDAHTRTRIYSVPKEPVVLTRLLSDR